MTNMHRRTFLTAAGIAAVMPRTVASASLDSPSTPHQLTGNGEWTYAVVSGWGDLPDGTAFGGTHGAIAQDKAGNIYVSTQSETGVLVYNSDGRLLRRIATPRTQRSTRSSLQQRAERNIYMSRCRRASSGELALSEDEN